MYRPHYSWRQAGANPSSSFPRDAELISEEGLSSGRPQAHENAWLHQPNLRIEPGPARLNFGRARLLVDSPLPPFIWRPFEVLHDICDIDFIAVDSRQAQSLIKYLSCRSNKRPAAEIFFVSGLLAHQHNRGFRRSFAKNGLRRRFP